MISIFSFSITEFWKGLCDKISILSFQTWAGMSLKNISLFSSGGNFVMCDQTFCPYLAEDIMPNTSRKLF